MSKHIPKFPLLALCFAAFVASASVGAGSSPTSKKSPGANRRPATVVTLTEEQFGEVDRAAASGISDPVPYLADILSLSNEIKEMLDPADVARMKQLESHIQALIAGLRDPNRGPLHRETHEALITFIQSMDIASRYFFKQIAMSYVTPRTNRISDTVEVLAKAYGYDRSAYTQNLYRTLNQVQLHLVEMMKKPLSDALLRKINALKIKIGYATATASTGDRPKAFNAVYEITTLITGMYPEFNQLVGSKEVFENAQVIQDLNEYLINYGQYESTNR